MHRIGEVENIDAEIEAKLVGLGIRTTDDFLARAATPGERAGLATAVGATPAELLTWANCADLMRIDGIGMQFADLLEEAGVDTIPELAQRNAPNLYERVAALNDQKQLAGRAPTAHEVESWVAQAKMLPRIIEFAGPAPVVLAPAFAAAAPAPIAAPEPVPAPAATIATPAAVADTGASTADRAVDSAAGATQNARSEVSAGEEHASDAGREAAGDAETGAATRAQDAASTGATRLGEASSTARTASASWWQKLMARVRGA
jgi:predicted flap endonuclease-1-like 5' DNA nuclease